MTLNREFGREEVIALVGKTLAFQREAGLWGLLCDSTDMTTPAKMPDVMDVVVMLHEFDLPPEWRQAILHPHDVNTAMMLSLWVAAGNNRGFKVAMFRDRDEALAWLDAEAQADPAT